MKELANLKEMLNGDARTIRFVPLDQDDVAVFQKGVIPNWHIEREMSGMKRDAFRILGFDSDTSAKLTSVTIRVAEPGTETK
jgi:hypothetical protein